MASRLRQGSLPFSDPCAGCEFPAVEMDRIPETANTGAARPTWALPSEKLRRHSSRLRSEYRSSEIRQPLSSEGRPLAAPSVAMEEVQFLSSALDSPPGTAVERGLMQPAGVK